MFEHHDLSYHVLYNSIFKKERKELGLTTFFFKLEKCHLDIIFLI